VSEMPLTSEKVRLTCTAAYPPCQLTADGLQDSARARTQTRNRKCDNANAEVQGPAERTSQRGRAKLHGRGMTSGDYQRHRERRARGEREEEEVREKCKMLCKACALPWNDQCGHRSSQDRTCETTDTPAAATLNAPEVYEVSPYSR
jgi:hypothetical protein